ncbi:MAG: hypothetical protein HY720_13000 [Planctomycetes bacterium]|nr:hypothetical protein [Planctomycetota bacterium]
MTRERRRSALAGVPRRGPALSRAEAIQAKAAVVGFDFPSFRDAWAKVEEEIAEIDRLLARRRAIEDLEGEIGDLLFAITNGARLLGIDPERALQGTNEKFIARFRHVETRLAEDGRSPADSSLAEMDRLWDEAKRWERRCRRSS